MISEGLAYCCRLRQGVDYDSMDSDGPIDDELYVLNVSKRRMPDAPAVDAIHSSGVLRNWVGGELLLQNGQF